MKLKISQLTTLAIAIVALGLTGCDPSSKAPDSNSTASAQKPAKTFAMNVLVSTVPFFDDTRATWSAIGKYNGVTTVYCGPVNTDPQTQINEIEALLSKGLDGLVVAPCDSAALAPVINKAVEKGVMVVTYLNDVPASKRTTYVTSELEEASLKVGRHVIQKNNNPAKAIIVYAEAGNLEQMGRRRGFEMLTNEFANLQIVAVVEDKFDAAKATEQMQPLLAKFPDVAYVFGCGSRSAVGTVAALRELKFKPGQVVVTGWDYDEDELNLISEGWVTVAAAQNTSYMTQIAFNILEGNVGGYLYPINHPFKEHGVRALPEKIVVPVELVTKSNLLGYMPRK